MLILRCHGQLRCQHRLRSELKSEMLATRCLSITSTRSCIRIRIRCTCTHALSVALQLFVLLLFNGRGRWKLFAKLLHLCSLRRYWRRQLMDMEHPFAFASQVSSGAFKVFLAYLQLTSISPVQCKISSRNELNCNTFWCPIRSYLCIIKSNTCSEALMSPLQLNYSAARAERENQCQSVEWTK